MKLTCIIMLQILFTIGANSYPSHPPHHHEQLEVKRRNAEISHLESRLKREIQNHRYLGTKLNTLRKELRIYKGNLARQIKVSQSFKSRKKRSTSKVTLALNKIFNYKSFCRNLKRYTKHYKVLCDLLKIKKKRNQLVRYLVNMMTEKITQNQKNIKELIIVNRRLISKVMASIKNYERKSKVSHDQINNYRRSISEKRRAIPVYIRNCWIRHNEEKKRREEEEKLRLQKIEDMQIGSRK